MSDDEIGSASNDPSKAPMDPSTKLAVAEGLVLLQGVAEIAGGGAEVLFDPSAGVTAINEGADRVAVASDMVERSVNDASQASLAAQRAREHEFDPPQASMTEITKDEARRNDEYTKEVEEANRRLRGDDGDMPHGEYGELKPGEVDPATGRPVPYPTSNPGVDPAAE